MGNLTSSQSAVSTDRCMGTTCACPVDGGSRTGSLVQDDDVTSRASEYLDPVTGRFIALETWPAACVQRALPGGSTACAYISAICCMWFIQGRTPNKQLWDAAVRNGAAHCAQFNLNDYVDAQDAYTS